MIRASHHTHIMLLDRLKIPGTLETCGARKLAKGSANMPRLSHFSEKEYWTTPFIHIDVYIYSHKHLYMTYKCLYVYVHIKYTYMYVQGPGKRIAGRPWNSGHQPLIQRFLPFPATCICSFLGAMVFGGS